MGAGRDEHSTDMERMNPFDNELVSVQGKKRSGSSTGVSTSHGGEAGAGSSEDATGQMCNGGSGARDENDMEIEVDQDEGEEQETEVQEEPNQEGDAQRSTAGYGGPSRVDMGERSKGSEHCISFRAYASDPYGCRVVLHEEQRCGTQRRLDMRSGPRYEEGGRRGVKCVKVGPYKVRVTRWNKLMPTIDWELCGLVNPIFKKGYDAMVLEDWPPVSRNGARMLADPDRCDAIINHIRKYGVSMGDGTHVTLYELGEDDMIVGRKFRGVADSAIRSVMHGRVEPMPRNFCRKVEGYVDIIDAEVFRVKKSGQGHRVIEPRHGIQKRLSKKKMGKKGDPPPDSGGLEVATWRVDGSESEEEANSDRDASAGPTMYERKGRRKRRKVDRELSGGGEALGPASEFPGRPKYGLCANFFFPPPLFFCFAKFWLSAVANTYMFRGLSAQPYLTLFLTFLSFKTGASHVSTYCYLCFLLIWRADLQQLTAMRSNNPAWILAPADISK